MRTFAKHIITQAAVAAGLDTKSVLDLPDHPDSMLLPKKRVDVEYLTNNLTPRSRCIGSWPTPDDETTRTFRRVRYAESFTVRAVVRSDDEVWLATFVRAFLLALPRKTADADGNLVRIRASKAVRGGFGSRVVEVMAKRSNALHIVFEGLICEDTTRGMIPDVNIKDGVQRA